MLDYDKEADAYDTLRGGAARARAAADAVLGLLPAVHAPADRPGRLLDTGCGTGIVTRLLAGALPALRVTGVDRSTGMAARAAARLPGAVLLADSRRLPFPDRTFDAVTGVWLLHLLPRPAGVRAVLAECARVLRPGGTLVVTVDKSAAHDVGSDIDTVLLPRPRRTAPDDAGAVTALAAEQGLTLTGRAEFRAAVPAAPSPT